MSAVSAVLLNLFLVGVVACLAPLLIYFTRASLLPVVVLEIVGGIIIGPQVLNWVHVDAFPWCFFARTRHSRLTVSATPG